MPTRINPEKLLLSKWTAAAPQNKEKHFLVTKLLRDELEVVISCELQAVLTQRTQTLDWRALQDDTCWRQGWR